MKLRSFIIILLLFFMAFTAYGQETGSDISELKENRKSKKTEGLIIEPDINYWGMNADISIYGFELIENLSSRVLISGGAGIRSIGYYRDENDSHIEKDDGKYDVYNDFKYFRIHTNWGVGLSQGIVNAENCRNDFLTAVFKYRGIREWNFEDDNFDQVIFNSTRKDKDGILLNSFIVGLVMDCVSEDKKSGNISGYYSEASVERAPEWFFNDIEGESDFIKYFGSFTFYVPMAEFRNKKGEIVSGLYFAESFSADFVDGDKIPLLARQTMGSLFPENGLGGKIRGFETRRFDGELTFANNLEARLTFPVIRSSLIPGKYYLRPGIFSFFDSGYYDLLEGSDPGFLLSCGGGIFGDISGIIQGVAFLSFPLEGERLDEKSMDFSLSLNFHF